MHMRTVMVGWRKGMATASHTYLVEVGDASMWLGRLGKGGAYWEPKPGAVYFGGRIEGQTQEERTAGVALGLAAGQKALARFRREIDENERRYWAEGRAALAGDKHTTEWPLSELAGAVVVEGLPGSAPPAMKGLGPGFVEARPGGKVHYFAGLPHGASAPELHRALMAALGR